MPPHLLPGRPAVLGARRARRWGEPPGSPGGPRRERGEVAGRPERVRVAPEVDDIPWVRTGALGSGNRQRHASRAGSVDPLVLLLPARHCSSHGDTIVVAIPVGVAPQQCPPDSALPSGASPLTVRPEHPSDPTVRVGRPPSVRSDGS